VAAEQSFASLGKTMPSKSGFSSGFAISLFKVDPTQIQKKYNKQNTRYASKNNKGKT
jgi:hypothetical protein